MILACLQSTLKLRLLVKRAFSPKKMKIMLLCETTYASSTSTCITSTRKILTSFGWTWVPDEGFASPSSPGRGFAASSARWGPPSWRGVAHLLAWASPVLPGPSVHPQAGSADYTAPSARPPGSLLQNRCQLQQQQRRLTMHAKKKIKTRMEFIENLLEIGLKYVCSDSKISSWVQQIGK